MNDEPSNAVETADAETKQRAMILHLSLLSGLVVPIIIYVLKKDSLPGLVPHGHVVFNWMISAAIYFVASVFLIFLVIGIFTIVALIIFSIIFPIIGAIKASEGEVWAYPLSIPIFQST